MQQGPSVAEAQLGHVVQPDVEAHGQRSLDVLRRRLLDLKTSNPQLNMRLGKSYVRVVDEVPEQIFEALDAGRAFEFASLPKPMPKRSEAGSSAPDILEVARASGIDPSYELPTPAATPASKHSDNRIQTLLFPDDLDSVLERLRRRAKTLLEELGVPTLHIVFGSLEWFDSDASDRAMLAPLVLVQVDLRRELKQGQYRYYIGGSSELEPLTNDTLRLKLRRDFAIELPELSEERELGSYFQAVADLVRPRDRWRVRRHVSLGLFRFERLVMYQDLAAGDWSLKDHPLLQRMLAMTDDPSQPAWEPDDLDAPEFEARAPLLVTDADSSQTIAVADALAGQNLVVRGPPGTGKSQTITNLIAAALAEGKSVLFVAEKMAALEVVRKRLVDAQLGDFALDLHSTAASKREVLSHIEKRLALTHGSSSPEVYERARAQLRQVRSELNDYLRAVHAPFGATGASLYEILWRQEHLRPPASCAWFAPLSRLRVAGVLDLTADELRREMEALSLYQVRRAEVFPAGKNGHPHPWGLVLEPNDIQTGADEALLSYCQTWAEKLKALDALREMLAQVRLSSLQDLSGIAEVVATFERPPNSLLSLADALQAPALRRAARRVLPAITNLSELGRLVGSVGLPTANLERSCAALGRALDAAEQVHLELATLGNLAAALETEAQTQGDLEAAGAGIRQACAALGWRISSVEPWVVHAFFQLAALVEQASRAVLLLRSDSVIEEGTPGLVHAAFARVRRVRELTVGVDEWASGWRTRDAQELRAAALALREAGIWGRLFGTDYRQARRSVVALLRGTKLSRDEMAVRAQRCAEVLEEIRHVEADPTLRALLPNGTDWQSVDLELVFAAIQWCEEVRRATAGVTDEAGLVRAAAFQATPDTLAAVLDIATRHRASWTRPRVTDWTEGDLGAVAANRRSKAELGIAEVRSLLREGLAPEIALQTFRAITTLASRTEGDARVIVEESQLVTALGERWRMLSREPTELAHALNWVDSMESWAKQIGLKAPAGEPWSTWCDRVESWATATTTAAVEERLARGLATSVGVAADRVLERASGDPSNACALLSPALAAPGRLRDWIGYLRALHAAQQFHRLVPVVEAVESLDDNLIGIDKGYAWLVQRELTLQAQRHYPALNSDKWSGEQLASTRARFVALDRQILKTQQEEVRTRLLARPVLSGNGVGPRGDWTDLALVRNEVAKQKRHIPIRQLLARAHNAVLALTPCLMMSPLSVAQFLPRTTGMFDLLIVDEASQMRPEDAVCALARAKQAVIVGDENQLPPTSFFDSSNDDDDDLANDDERGDQRLESILDWSRSSFSHARELLWHYRSRHESLIAFSNDRFYDGRLLVFPSSSAPGINLGVRLCSVVDGVYNASLNEREARAVVSEVMNFMRANPSRTLGVVAMNRPQADLIEKLLDEEIRQSGDDSYRERWGNTLTPFFVKNLESVQGDERDVMFASLTYGPSAPGGKVAQRFGPVRGEDGHKRLNVLFTRAREQVTVFSSMKPSDITVDGTSRLGVKVLRDYIEYAADGGRLTTNRPRRERAGHDSPFEESVAALLKAEGFDPEPQVGVQGFFIDLGVRHHKSQSGFVCGVECDGAAYHSTRSARDRDRIRQAVLEGLGWKIIRVWSTDWFHNPAQARAKVIRQVHEALADAIARRVSDA